MAGTKRPAPTIEDTKPGRIYSLNMSKCTCRCALRVFNLNETAVAKLSKKERRRERKQVKNYTPVDSNHNWFAMF